MILFVKICEKVVAGFDKFFDTVFKFIKSVHTITKPNNEV